MKSKSKDEKKAAAAKTVSLGEVLDQSQKIKKTIKQAATKLTSVNEILQQPEELKSPVQTIKQAITQNRDVENKVAQAAEDLTRVNTELAKEVAERAVIESELADTKADLAEARDDLSRSQANEEATRKSGLLDTLTGLPNRAFFEQRFDHGLIQARRHGWGLAVLFIDIDKFKSINDSHGHDLGDKVLLMVASRLRAFVREEDTVSRWGGDEFVCLMLEVKQDADVARVAEKIVARIAEASEFDGTVLSVGVSIGVAIYPADGETADILFKKADQAMYKAKGGEKRVVLFHASPP